MPRRLRGGAAAAACPFRLDTSAASTTARRFFDVAVAQARPLHARVLPVLLPLLLLAPALSQMPIPAGVVSPIYACPNPNVVSAEFTTTHQDFCQNEFFMCAGGGPVTSAAGTVVVEGSPETVATSAVNIAHATLTVGTTAALLARTQLCQWCFADLWTCYQDCLPYQPTKAVGTPPFNLPFITACTRGYTKIDSVNQITVAQPPCFPEANLEYVCYGTDNPDNVPITGFGTGDLAR